jgi:hypothetical protein
LKNHEQEELMRKSIREEAAAKAAAEAAAAKAKSEAEAAAKKKFEDEAAAVAAKQKFDDEAAAAKARDNNNHRSSSLNNNNNNSNNINGSSKSSSSLSANNNLTKNPRGGSDILSHSLNSQQNKFGDPGSDFNRRGKSALDAENGGCCGGSAIQLVLPQNSISSACSGKNAKIIIPVHSEKLLDANFMRELVSISEQATSTSSMLESMQKLAEKYEL